MAVSDLLAAEGARFAEADVSGVTFDPMFRTLCEKNSCGYYGACWTCPPDAGTIDELMARVKTYRRMLVFQTVSPLEDSYDIEGMQEAAKRHNRLVQRVRDEAKTEHPGCLMLGAGTCGVCARCTRRDNLPCRFPDKAILSLEACGIDVSALAKLVGMKYINGANTVTYFGAVLYN